MQQPQETPTPDPASQPAARRRSLAQSFQRFPVSFGLITFTLFIFLLQILSQQLSNYDLLLLMGAKVNRAIAAGDYWRLITPIFLHVGFWHVGVNMYSLYALGPAIERFFGAYRMLVIYLLCGLSGVIFSLAFSSAASVGASGAIFGLLGALGTFLYRHRASFGAAGRFHLRQIALVAVINLGIGFMPQIDNWGHMGGLLGGVLLTWFVGPKYELLWSHEGQPALHDRRPWSQAWPNALIALLLLIGLAIAALFSPFTR